MKRHFIICILAAAFALTAGAQEQAQEKKSTIEVPQWVKDIRLSGYGMMQYQAEDKDEGKHNEFNVRLMRVSLSGKISDFDWLAQVQGSSNAGPGNPTVMLVDLYAEWEKYPEFRIKAGQYKRPFTFDNPMHPITQGWYSYSMMTCYLAGMGDRTGEKASGGRDMGVQIQGDLFPNSDGRRLLHYQVGVFNGEGINQKDMDNRKDIIGGLWVMPIEGLRVGAFGWTGSRYGIGSKNRYALSAEYAKDEYNFRAEYAHSQGWGSAKPGNDTREIDPTKGTKADGWYASAIVPVVKSKLHAKARYQCYRQSKAWDTSNSLYEIGVNYFLTKDLQINAEYGRGYDRSVAATSKRGYNLFDVELDFRF